MRVLSKSEEGIRVFAGGGRRTAQLRSLALSAFAAAREADDPAAAAAARAACLAAASAYTHPLADVHQTKHIVGPAAYAALALELDHAGRQSIGDGEVCWAITHVTSEEREVLLQMLARQAGKSRLDTLLYMLDAASVVGLYRKTPNIKLEGTNHGTLCTIPITQPDRGSCNRAPSARPVLHPACLA